MIYQPVRLLPVVAVFACASLIPGFAQAGAGQVYWTNATADSIQRASLDGSGVQTVRPGISSLGMAVDRSGGKLYWTDLGNPDVPGDESIRRANLDGSAVEVLVDNADGISHPIDIELDLSSAKMYWTDGGVPAGRIFRANLDGSAVEVVFQVLDHRAPNFGGGPGQTFEFAAVWGLALDTLAGNMYWTDFFGADVHRASLDGSNVSGPLVSGQTTPRGIELDVAGNRMYWTDSFESTISSAALDGSNVQSVVTDVDGVDEPFGVALDRVHGKLYWTNAGSGEVQRSDPSGNNVETIVVLTNQDLLDIEIPASFASVPALSLGGQTLLVILLAVCAARALSRRTTFAPDRQGM